MSENYFQSGEFKEILRRFEESERGEASEFFDYDQLMDIAEYYNMLGNVSYAKQIIEKAIHIFPDSIYPQVFKARMALVCDNDPALARDIVSNISDTTDLEYIYIVAEIMLYEQQYDKADRYLGELYTEMDEETALDFVIDVATLFADYEDSFHAEKWLMCSPETDAEDYQDIKGRIETLKGNYEEAEKIFNELLDQDPYSTDYWNHLASAQLRAGKFGDSIQSCEFTLAINPDDADAVLLRANALLQIAYYEQAAKAFAKYAQLRPQEETGELYQAVALSNLNCFEEAVTHYQRAERLCHKSLDTLHDIYHDLAFCLSRLKRMDEALAYTDKLEKLAKDRDYDIAILRGHIYLENNDAAKSRDCFLEAIASSEGDPEVFFRIAISSIDNGYVEYAYQCLQVMFALVPDDWKEGYAYLALCCKELNKKDEYLAALQTACEINPEEAKTALDYLFPDSVRPEDYYEYTIHQHQENT